MSSDRRWFRVTVDVYALDAREAVNVLLRGMCSDAPEGADRFDMPRVDNATAVPMPGGTWEAKS